MFFSLAHEEIFLSKPETPITPAAANGIHVFGFLAAFLAEWVMVFVKEPEYLDLFKLMLDAKFAQPDIKKSMRIQTDTVQLRGCILKPT